MHSISSNIDTIFYPFMQSQPLTNFSINVEHNEDIMSLFYQEKIITTFFLQFGCPSFQISIYNHYSFETTAAVLTGAVSTSCICKHTSQHVPRNTRHFPKWHPVNSAAILSRVHQAKEQQLQRHKSIRYKQEVYIPWRQTQRRNAELYVTKQLRQRWRPPPISVGK